MGCGNCHLYRRQRSILSPLQATNLSPLQAPTKEKKRKKIVELAFDPDIRGFLDWWATEYKAVNRDPYLFAGNKEAPLVRRLLATYGLDRLQEMARAFLRSEDPFVLRSGFTIGVFHGQANRLARDVGSRPRLVVIPSDVFLRQEAMASEST